MNGTAKIIALGVLVGCSSSTFAFTLISNASKPAYWPTHKTSYRFNTTTSGYFQDGVDASGTPSDEFQPIRDAFQTWLNLPGLDLSVTEDSATSKAASTGDNANTIQWVPNSWASLSFRPPSQALAVTLLSFNSDTGAITDADIYFNATHFKWAVVDSPSEWNYIDVQNIATHEIGHFLGLDHSSESLFEDDAALADATMYYASSSGETSRRSLHSDDELAIRALYGTANRGPIAVSSAEMISSVSKMLMFRIQGHGFNEYTSFVMTKDSHTQLDIVARYRIINSESEATAQFDAAGMDGGTATIVAFNDPTQIARVSVQLDTMILGATESGGGGGCSVRVDENSSSMFAILALAFTLLTLSLRRRFARA